MEDERKEKVKMKNLAYSERERRVKAEKMMEEINKQNKEAETKAAEELERMMNLAAQELTNEKRENEEKTAKIQNQLDEMKKTLVAKDEDSKEINRDSCENEPSTRKGRRNKSRRSKIKAETGTELGNMNQKTDKRWRLTNHWRRISRKKKKFKYRKSGEEANEGSNVKINENLEQKLDTDIREKPDNLRAFKTACNIYEKHNEIESDKETKNELKRNKEEEDEKKLAGIIVEEEFEIHR
jgi:hypothetical protein